MKFHWFDERFYGGKAPICAHAPPDSASCSHPQDITCKWCLRKYAKIKAMVVDGGLDKLEDMV